MKAYDSWFKQNPVAGFFSYSLIFIVWIPLLLPASLLSIVGGFIFTRNFGTIKGFFLCYLAICLTHPLGALVAFYMSKYLLKSFIQTNILNRIRIFQAVDRAIKLQGLKCMILIKIQPVIPWLALNWVLGVTQCTATHFFIGTLIGMSPLTITAIYVGMNMHNI